MQNRRNFLWTSAASLFGGIAACFLPKRADGEMFVRHFPKPQVFVPIVRVNDWAKLDGVWISQRIVELADSVNRVGLVRFDVLGFSSHSEVIAPVKADGYSALISTADYQYHITVKPNYLGCIVSRRFPNPGETCNDLADGRFTIETWNEIVKDVTDYEFGQGRWHRGSPITAEGIIDGIKRRYESFDRYDEAVQLFRRINEAS